MRKQHVAKMAAATVLALGVSSAFAGPFFFSGGPAANNVDTFAGTSHSIVVGAGGLKISDLNVSVAIEGGVNSGTQWGDLDITISNGSTTVFLLAQSQINDCCNSGVFNVTFDDEAATVITTMSNAGVTAGNFQPEGTPSLLSAFDGQNLSGTWTLTITEIFCCENESDNMTWSISGTAVPEPGSLALLGLGLLGLGGLRRK